MTRRGTTRIYKGSRDVRAEGEGDREKRGRTERKSEKRKRVVYHNYSGAVELLSRLLQFRDINNPFLAGRSRARGLGFTLTPFSDATRGASGADRGRWSSLRLDKRLFIQRGRKLIHDATSLHFLRVWQARIPLLKRIPLAVRGSEHEHGATKYEVTAFSFLALLKNCFSPQQRHARHTHVQSARGFVESQKNPRRMADSFDES